ncbi:MAG: YqgE/AlgH family protein [Ilumatobacteraceae bacterium]
MTMHLFSAVRLRLPGQRRPPQVGHNSSVATDHRHRPTHSCRGRLLVATPPLDDPHFDRSVVFVLEHGDAGAIGVVVNQCTDEGCPDEIAAWGTHLQSPAAVFTGGPVERAALIGLALAVRPADEGWNELAAPDGGSVWPGAPASAALGSVDLTESPASIAERLVTARLFRGYSGWSAGQLDRELAEGSWMVFDATIDDVFTGDPDSLWRRVIARQGGRTSWVAAAPDDLSAN